MSPRTTTAKPNAKPASKPSGKMQPAAAQAPKGNPKPGGKPPGAPANPRTATIERATKETKVTATFHLDGSGAYDVRTDNKFLTHMVETWTRYADFDLHLRATGDLDHHLVEDVGIVLGQAFKAAFRNAPCTRIAYDFVPMDDALVLCAVDLVDRPHYAGELPVPLWDHFFRSFAMEARINLHFEQLRGRDTHHTIEAATKAFARALRRALEPRASEVSTKGVARLGTADAATASDEKPRIARTTRKGASSASSTKSAARSPIVSKRGRAK